jgi:hypothetical protein
MHWKILAALAFTLPFMSARADVNRFEAERTNKLTVVSPDGTAQLTVAMERLDHEKIKRIDKGRDQTPEAWLGKRQLPAGILWHRSTMIQSFDLTIDGKPVKIPARFWNDLPGLDLQKVLINKKLITHADQWELWNFTQSIARPQISRSANKGTVLITWKRPEE